MPAGSERPGPYECCHRPRGLHGFLAEYYVDAVDFLVKVPEGLKQVAVQVVER